MSPPNHNPIHDSLLRREVIKSTNWFIKIRWFPGLALAGLPWLTPYVPQLALHPLPLSICGILLLTINALLAFFIPHWLERVSESSSKKGLAQARMIMGLEVVLDWAVTGFALHWSGGVQSPLLLLLLVHLSLTTVLFRRRECILLAILATLLVALLGILYATGTLSWHPMWQNQAPPTYLAVMVRVASFCLVALSLAWLSSTLAKHIRDRGRTIYTLTSNLEKSYSRLMALFSITRETSTILDREILLKKLAEKTTRTLKIQACVIHLPGMGSGKLKTACAFSLDYTEEAMKLEPVESDMIDQVLAGQSTSLNISPDNPDPWVNKLNQEGWKSVAGAPIAGKEGVIGIIWTLCRIKHKLTEEDARFLDTVGTHAGIALENAQSWTNMRDLDEKKNQFINIITHELRSPVAVTQSLVDTLAGGFAGELATKQQVLVERAQKRLHALEKLVNDLLNLAQAKALPTDKEDGERTDLVELTSRVVKRHQTVVKDKEQNLELHCGQGHPCWVNGAHDKLDRILDNLLSNAVKYTPPQGSIKVTIYGDQDYQRVKITDTGIGIPEKSIPRLGKEFFRAPNARKIEPVGTGLGLAITRDLITSLGGRMEIESKVGVGSTFTIRFPTP